MMLFIVGFVILLWIIYRVYQYYFPTPNIDPNGKYVLISGCDTGFGYQLAIELDHKGFHVLAGVYLQDNIISLQNKLSFNATVFQLDITNQNSIDTAFDIVTKKTKVLHALVNNADLATGGHIDWISMQTMRKIMNVNYFGHVAMTKKFLPLLIAKRDSRVINMSSMCGYISLPGSSAYCASKYALESFSDCLRREMASWGLRVSIVEPGTMRTAMTEGMEDSLKNIWHELSTDIQERWGEQFFNDSLKMIMTSPFIKYSECPSKVIRVLDHAITSTTPRIRYRPGLQSSYFFFPLSLLPAWLVDKLLSQAFRTSPTGVKNQSNE
ncbi:unnamed protein product [Adineta steineri]|uniref:Uncharacterized protein n=1 Tax=Adineta steineri TaxID=433720 RepID=A0A815EFR7_9BILA|nr:unnamed protein product [Adineta steineri]CAF3759838.1 unnamed protein product [Adineta steineri]